MEVIILTKLKNDSAFYNRCRGMSEDNINALEAKFNEGKPFPKAFREFLFIAGEYDATGVNNDDIPVLQEDALEVLAETGNEISRPFIVFNGDNGCEVFEFIYLDETYDDPDIYVASPLYTRRGIKLIVKMGMTLSQLIESNMDLRSQNMPVT